MEASMSYIGYATNNYGLVIAAVLYLIMNVYSYTKWTQAEKRPKGHARKSEESIVIDAIKDNYNDTWRVSERGGLTKDARRT